MKPRIFFGARTLATLLATSASGCWLVWGIEPLSEEAGTGGASTTSQGTSTSTENGPGGGGGGPPAAGCSPHAAMDGSFRLLTVCHGFSPRRIATVQDHIVVGGDGSEDATAGFVKTFDFSGLETGGLTMADARRISVAGYKPAGSPVRVVISGNYEPDTVPNVAGQEPAQPCAGMRCGFVAVIGVGSGAPAWPVEWLDPGATGFLDVAGVDVEQIQAHQDRHFVGVVGSFRGSVQPFDAATPLSADPSIVGYLITADVEDDAPSGTHHRKSAQDSRAIEAALHRADVEELRATVVGFQGANATLLTLEPENDLGVWFDVDEPGAYVDIARAGLGFRVLRAAGERLYVHEYGSQATANLTVATLDFAGGRMAANEAGHTFVGGGFTGDITVGGTALSNAGDGSTRDMLLVHLDAEHVPTPHVLKESSPDDATIEDVVVDASGRVFFVASFHGQLHFGGQTFVASPNGSMFVGELSD